MSRCFVSNMHAAPCSSAGRKTLSTNGTSSSTTSSRRPVSTRAIGSSPSPPPSLTYFPTPGSGLRYEYGMFRQMIQDGWQRARPDNWLRRPDAWEVARPHDRVEVKLNCSFALQGGSLQAIVGKPSRLYGMPFDRPVVGYGGKT